MSSSRTELAKMGKYIAKLRKDKKYTQRQLGDLIDIPYKTISKWENGVIAPDITVLQNLANTLDVTVDELLCGESLNDDSDLKKKNSATIFGIKYYVKIEKNKFLRNMLFIVVFFLIALLFVFLINNYYKWEIVNLNYSSDEYEVSGKFVANNNTGILILDNFDYVSDKLGTLEEPQILLLKLSIYYDGKELISDQRTYNESTALNSCLDNYFYIYEGDKLSKNIDFKKISVILTYLSESNEENNISISFK